MGIKRKLAAAAVAIASVTGITLATAVPAEAVTLSRVAYCNWPYKASVQIYNHSGSFRMDAYSPSGYKLGSYYGSGNATWHTPWEDVIVWAYTSDSSYNLYHHCRL